jgi:hypothetical protein
MVRGVIDDRSVMQFIGSPNYRYPKAKIVVEKIPVEAFLAILDLVDRDSFVLYLLFKTTY